MQVYSSGVGSALPETEPAAVPCAFPIPAHTTVSVARSLFVK